MPGTGNTRKLLIHFDLWIPGVSPFSGFLLLLPPGVQVLYGEESKHLQLSSCRNLITVTDKEK